ncbi:MAG: FG-GAP repeat protein [Flavobacteriales bacterium]|nr:FG-GAP repeat protein [Flavobacteriales bacterium]
MLERSNRVSTQLGFSVDTAGDINGDGLSDAVVSAPHFDNPHLMKAGILVLTG